MIDLPATGVKEKPGFVPEDPHFRVDSAAGNPLMAVTPIAFSQHDDAIEAAPVESDSYSREADTLLEKLVTEAGRQVERYPSSPSVLTNLGLALLNRGKLAEAAHTFEMALKLAPGQYLPEVSLARVKVLQGKLDEAQERYLQLEERRPTDPNPIIHLADIAVRRGHFDEAVRLWKKALKLKADDPFAHFHLGMALLASNHHQEAIGELRAATHLEARSALLYHGLGVAYTFAKEYRRAVKAFMAALTLAPEMPEAFQGLCDAFLKQGQVKSAIEMLDEHLKNKPDDYQARELLAWAFIRQGRYKEVRKELFHALSAIPKTGEGAETHQARLANNLGVCYWLLGNQEEAQKRFLTAIGAKANLGPGPYLNLVRLYLEMRHFGEARQIIGLCTTRFPQHEEARFLLANVFETQGYYDKAIQELQSLVGSETASLVAYKYLANLLTNWKRDPDAALPILNEAYQKFPKDAGVINNLAYTHLMRGDPAAARRVLALIPKRIPQVVEIVLSATWGLLHLWEGDFMRGNEGYEKAEQIARRLGKSPMIPEIQQKKHLELARAYQRSGDVKAAKQEVREGLAKRGADHYHRDLKLLSQTL